MGRTKPDKKVEIEKRFPASYGFLSQLAADIRYVEEHPMLATTAQERLKIARETVSQLCYSLHGQHPGSV